MFLYRLADALLKHRVRYALVGGYAVALHGAIRGTLDVDLVLQFSEAQFRRAEKVFLELGLRPRLPISAKEVFHFREEYIENRNLKAWSFHNPSTPSEVLDVIITHDLKKMKTKRLIVKGHKIVIASVPDLIAMKQLSNRPQDIEDIKALRRLSK